MTYFHPARFTSLLLAFVSNAASAVDFTMPLQVQGLESKGNVLTDDSPLHPLIKEYPGICDAVGVYTYADTTQASAGIDAYLKNLKVTAESVRRTQYAAVWKASNKDKTTALIGVWRASSSGGGVLEMCGQTVSSTSRSQPFRGGLWLTGALALAAVGYLRKRANRLDV